MMVSTSDLYLGGRTLYFNAFRGFGSNSECNQFSEVSICAGYGVFCDRFCWLWQIPGPWRAVDHISQVHSHMATEALILWFIVPSIMILCTVTSLIGTILLIRSYLQSHEYRTVLIQYLRELSQEEEAMNQRSCCLSFHRRSCLISQNSAIWCFVLTSLFSHCFLLGLSLCDTLNPSDTSLSPSLSLYHLGIWEQFMISLVSVTLPLEASSVDNPSLRIIFTFSGWLFFLGMLLSYFIWIGMFLFWVQFPVTCLITISSSSSSSSSSFSTPSLEEIELANAATWSRSYRAHPHQSPYTESELERIQNPITTLPPPLQRRIRSV